MTAFEDKSVVSRSGFLFIVMFACVVTNSAGANGVASVSSSFKCEKPSTVIEKVICSDTELAALDRQMSALYIEALNKSVDQADPARAEKVRAEGAELQRFWLNNVHQFTCPLEDKARSDFFVPEPASCLNHVYQIRVSELKRGNLRSANNLQAAFANEASVNGLPTPEAAEYQALFDDFPSPFFLSRTHLYFPFRKGQMNLSYIGLWPDEAKSKLSGMADAEVFKVTNAEEYSSSNEGAGPKIGGVYSCSRKITYIAVKNQSDKLFPTRVRVAALTVEDFKDYSDDKIGFCWQATWGRKSD